MSALWGFSMKNILITTGGTEESIDTVRSIGNFSSGRTGAYLADFLTHSGYSVTVLAHENVWVANSYLTEKYRYTKDLDKLLQTHLSKKEYQVVIHLAAVSDFFVKSISFQGDVKNALKISSEDPLELVLHPNKKLISQLRKYSKNKEVLIIGFKLLNSPDSEEEIMGSIKKLFSTSSIDYVVYNNLSEVTEDQHKTCIYDSHYKLISKGDTKRDLAMNLESLIKERV